MRQSSDITQESYEATAQLFAEKVADLAPMESIKKFMGFLPDNPQILDVGCGSGRDAKIFAELGASVLGIDFSTQLLNIAKKHAPDAEFQFMDINALSFPEDCFDGVWAACSLGHISKEGFSAVLTKIHTIIKPKGCFYLALKKGSSQGLEVDGRYEGNFQKFWAYYEEKELKTLLKAAKFEIVMFDVVEKKQEYHTHDSLRVFCQKN